MLWWRFMNAFNAGFTWQCWMSSGRAWTTELGPPLAPNRFSSSSASSAAYSQKYSIHTLHVNRAHSSKGNTKFKPTSMHFMIPNCWIKIRVISLWSARVIQQTQCLGFFFNGSRIMFPLSHCTKSEKLTQFTAVGWSSWTEGWKEFGRGTLLSL